MDEERTQKGREGILGNTARKWCGRDLNQVKFKSDALPCCAPSAHSQRTVVFSTWSSSLRGKKAAQFQDKSGFWRGALPTLPLSPAPAVSFLLSFSPFHPAGSQKAAGPWLRMENSLMDQAPGMENEPPHRRRSPRSTSREPR